MEKYGFVYIWRDRKHKRYYIGAHWGTEDDGYICSSKWMLKAYKIRSQDFKRRILQRIYKSKKETFNAEEKWLQLIKDEELKNKYYNCVRYVSAYWEDKKYIKGIKNRSFILNYIDMSSHIRCYHQSLARKGKPHSEEHKAALRKPKSPRSEEHTINLSNAIKGLTYKIKKTKCIKCGFKSNISHITRYHNENCKLYEINWKDIKNDYFIENYSFRALERKYNVNRMLIANKLRNGK